jgi:hypothetical protein
LAALPQWRCFVSLSLLALLPVSLSADDSAGAALLRSSGSVLVNQSAAPASIAVFAGDEIETRPGSSARIEYSGSSVEISSETLVRFESDEIVLEHGSVMVTSFRQFRVRAGCVVATPVAAEKTVYVVRDTDNRVNVNAQEKDVKLDSHSGNLKRASQKEWSSQEIVHQGEQKSREEHCGAGDLRTSAVGPASAPILNSPWVVAPASAIVIGGTACILFCFNDDPASPSSPSKSSNLSNHR